MLVFGSRMYGRRNVVKGWGICEHCGKYGKHTSYNGRKWEHLYFIPVRPDGPHVRVIRECKKCSRGLHIPEKDALALLNDLRQHSKVAVGALLAGQKECDINGTATSCAAYLTANVDLLHCLGADDYVRVVSGALQEKRLTYQYHLVNGASLEFQGKLDDAASAYEHAAESEPADPLPLLRLGLIHLKRKDYHKARPLYEKALELSQDKFPVLQVLLTVYGDLKDAGKLSETYEKCFALVPEMAQDKKAVKQYNKACKKAGRQPAL